MANELAAAESYVYGKVAPIATSAGWTYIVNSVTLPRVFSGIAPATATFPLVVISVQSPGADLIVVGGNRVWAEPLLLVRVIGKTASWTTIAATADAIDAAFHNTSGGAVAWCVRESPFSLIEVTDGIQYRHLGGLYRCRVTGG